MNYEKATQFRALVEGQAGGDSTAPHRLRSLAVSLEDGYCLYNLYGEWAGAFSFESGRLAALPVIVSLARKVAQYDADDTISMCNEPDDSIQRPDVGRETVHVHSEAVHVHVHEDAKGTRPQETRCLSGSPGLSGVGLRGVPELESSVETKFVKRTACTGT
jgi:hypothetical protein